MQSVRPLLLVLLTYGLLSCAPIPPAQTTSGSGKTSQCGDILVGVTIEKRELDLAGATLKEFSLGELNVKVSPEFQRITSEAAMNDDSKVKLACRAIEMAGVEGDPEMVAYFIQMQNFLSTNPSVDDRIKWKQAFPIPIKKNKSELSEQEARKPKVEITFNGLSQKELQAQFPLQLVLDPSLTATLSFVVTNIGNGPVINTSGAVFVEPRTVSVDRPGYWVHETRPNHHRYEIKGRTLLPKEMSDASYEFIAAVKVPEGIDTFTLLFKIVGDNLPHEDLGLVFKAIHPKRPVG